MSTLVLVLRQPEDRMSTREAGLVVGMTKDMAFLGQDGRATSALPLRYTCFSSLSSLCIRFKVVAPMQMSVFLSYIHFFLTYVPFFFSTSSRVDASSTIYWMLPLQEDCSRSNDKDQGNGLNKRVYHMWKVSRYVRVIIYCAHAGFYCEPWILFCESNRSGMIGLQYVEKACNAHWSEQLVHRTPAMNLDIRQLAT